MDKTDPFSRNKTEHKDSSDRKADKKDGVAPDPFSELVGSVERLIRLLDGREEEMREAYRIKKRLQEFENDWQRMQSESARLSEVLEKVTKPAFRIGTCLGVTPDGLAWVSVGGGDYQTTVDPRVAVESLKKGERVRLNEALSVLGTIGPDMTGPVVRVGRLFDDGRMEIASDRPDNSLGTVLDRSDGLKDEILSTGDFVRLDSSSRIALEKVRKREESYLLAEVPTVGWESIGGQEEAIHEIQKAILNPVLYPEAYSRYAFKSPRGFLLHGPPGCGKTLIGKATAREIARRLTEKEGRSVKGVFFHIKGPEILNMWLGESERIVRELFEEGRRIRATGDFPVLFIDEAEAILGTRRNGRGFNIHNTIVPMFCAELDGLAGPGGFQMVILATNRPEMIDPAILRPGRIDRKVKVKRPTSDDALGILKIHLGPEVPVLLSRESGDPVEPVSGETDREAILRAFRDRFFSKTDENAVFEVFRRSGKRLPVFRSDLASGAILGSIVLRAKEKALLRELGHGEGGVTLDDLLQAAEGDILPPAEIALEWMNLLDMETQDVVDVRKIRGSLSGRSSDAQAFRSIE
jgi:proteasome-associated ATPase